MLRKNISDCIEIYMYNYIKGFYWSGIMKNKSILVIIFYGI